MVYKFSGVSSVEELRVGRMILHTAFFLEKIKKTEVYSFGFKIFLT